jgi:hypothetical protein
MKCRTRRCSRTAAGWAGGYGYCRIEGMVQRRSRRRVHSARRRALYRLRPAFRVWSPWNTPRARGPTVGRTWRPITSIIVPNVGKYSEIPVRPPGRTGRTIPCVARKSGVFSVDRRRRRGVDSTSLFLQSQPLEWGVGWRLRGSCWSHVLVRPSEGERGCSPYDKTSGAAEAQNTLLEV